MPTLPVSSVPLMLCKTLRRLLTSTAEGPQYPAREEASPTEELLFPPSPGICIPAAAAHAAHLVPSRRKRRRR